MNHIVIVGTETEALGIRVSLMPLQSSELFLTWNLESIPTRENRRLEAYTSQYTLAHFLPSRPHVGLSCRKKNRSLLTLLRNPGVHSGRDKHKNTIALIGNSCKARSTHKP